MTIPNDITGHTGKPSHSISMIGCDELREWLKAQGFKMSIDYFRESDECNWYAYRKTELRARACETNEGRGLSVCVKPYMLTHEAAPNGYWESVEVTVTGESNGVGYQLKAYSLKPEEFKQKLPEIESRLIAAWNAL